MSIDPWAKLVSTFVAQSDGSAAAPTAADNVFIGWPPVLDFLQSRLEVGAKVLDFGCGTGQLVEHLSSTGYCTVGVISPRQ